MAHSTSDDKQPSSRSIAQRVLLVDDEQSLLDKMATLLVSQGFDVIRAHDGEEALTQFARQAIPVVVTDDQMPIMDGIEFTHRMRALAVQPTYVIMLTSMTASADIERGYCAGVDHYVTRQSWETALAARVVEGLKAIRLRRAARRPIAHYDTVTVDLQSGAHTARHLVGRLNAELMLAQRRQETMDLIIVGVDGPEKSRVRPNVASDEQLAVILGAIREAIRPQLDWVAWLHTAGTSHRFAITLPNRPGGVAEVEQSIRNALVAAGRAAGVGAQLPVLSFGATSFKATNESKPPAALELLGLGERSRRATTDAVKHATEVVQSAPG